MTSVKAMYLASQKNKTTVFDFFELHETDPLVSWNMYPDIDFLVLRSLSQLKSEYSSNLSCLLIEMKAYFQLW
jgi:hypothetical protein